MKIAYNSVSPLTRSGYGRCTAELVYRLLDKHDVDVFAYYGVQKADITTTLSGDKGDREVRIIGGSGNIQHPHLPAEAPNYDLIISHWDLWMSQFNPQWFDSIKQRHIWWAILDSHPLPFPIRQLLSRDALLYAIPMTEWGQQLIFDCPDVSNEKIGPVIPHGIDMEEWKPTKGGISGIPDNADFVVISVVSNTMRENIPVMVEGFAQFLKNTKADAYYYIHADPLPSGSGYFLHQIVKAVEESYDVDLKQRVLFKATSKRYPDEFMKQAYTRADCQLMAVMGGSFEIPILEAALCGTPTIATDFSGSGEVVGHGERGQVVRPVASQWMNLSSARQAQVSPLDIASALENYYYSPRLRRKHVSKMKSWIQQNATWDIVANKWLDLVDGVESDINRYGRAYFAGRDVDQREWVLIEQHVESPVLELGCGIGGLLQYLNSRGIEAVGIEVSGYAVSRCAEKGLTVWQESAEELPFVDDTYSYVVSQHLLEHTDYWKVIRESLRVAKKGCVHIVPGSERHDPTHKKGHFTKEELDEIAFKLYEEGYTATVFPDGGRPIDWVLKVEKEV